MNLDVMEPSQKKKERASSEAEDPGSSSRLVFANHSESQEAAYAAEHQGGSGILNILGGLFRSNSGGSQGDALPHDAQPIALKDALESLLQEHANAEAAPLIQPEERELLNNLLRFNEKSVEDIMIPRADIIALPKDASLEEVKQAFIEHQHSRLPVYGDTLDGVEGFLHLKDVSVHVFSGVTQFKADEIMRKILFVPPSMKVIDLLIKMRLNSQHIAIVVDEYGGTDGLVTMEDIVEVIVGEIQDEHDDEEDSSEHYDWIDANTLEADARLEIEELEAALGITLVLHEDEDEFDTLAGLIFTHLGRVPNSGESFDYTGGLKFTVLDADARSIKRVRVAKLSDAESVAADIDSQ